MRYARDRHVLCCLIGASRRSGVTGLRFNRRSIHLVRGRSVVLRARIVLHERTSSVSKIGC